MDQDEVGQLKTLVDQLKGLIRAKDEEVQEKNNTLKVVLYYISLLLY